MVDGLNYLITDRIVDLCRASLEATDLSGFARGSDFIAVFWRDLAADARDSQRDCRFPLRCAWIPADDDNGFLGTVVKATVGTGDFLKGFPSLRPLRPLWLNWIIPDSPGLVQPWPSLLARSTSTPRVTSTPRSNTALFVRFVFFPEALQGRACLPFLSRESFREWNDHCLHNRLNAKRRDAAPLHD